MPLPPYLTSAASSRAHHALLVRLDEAASPQEEAAIILEELERCRSVLAKNPKSSRVYQTLIILLHCSSITHTALDLEFALVPALQLAEGGKTLAERRMGYRYLCEQLPPDHELHLLLVNTIRKDLASEEEGHILAALGAIAHLPGVDLGPAVIPLLLENRLLAHDTPEIRQRSIQALVALQAPPSLRQLAKRIRHEDDQSVLASVLRAFIHALDGGREDDPTRRRRQFDSVFVAAERNLDGGSALLTQIIRALVAIVRSLPSQSILDDLATHVLQKSRSLLAAIVDRITDQGQPKWAVGDFEVFAQFGLAAPCHLEVCTLVSELHAFGSAGSGGDAVLSHIRHLLNVKGKGRLQDAASLDSPNAHISILKCLRRLTLQLWQEGLEEAQMAAIMGGIEHGDASVRRETLRLLCLVDRNIIAEALKVRVESIISNRNEEDAEKALEAVQIEAEGLPPSERGRKLALGTARISRALGDQDVWIQGVQYLLGVLHAGNDLRTAYTDALAEEVGGNATMTVLLASSATEHTPKQNHKIVEALLDALPSVPASVQEIVIIALVPLCATTPSQHALEVLRSVGKSASDHIAKRCDEVQLILDKDKAKEVVSRAKTRQLSDLLDAILAVNAELQQPNDDSPSPTLSASRRGRELRYAYEQPRRVSQNAMGRSMLMDHEEQ